VAKSTEVEKPFSELRPWEKTVRELHGVTAPENSDGFEVAASVADKILTAETLDDVINAVQAGPGDLTELVGKAFQFIGGTLSWHRAAEQYREGGTGFYAVFRVMLLDGEEKMISTGANNVIFQLRRMEDFGIFDNPGELTEKHFTVVPRTTGSGTTLFSIGYA
jgi:hypothetical protein